MAGLDGIQNKIHPGDAMDKNHYDLPPAELAEVPTVCASLREALESLAASKRSEEHTSELQSLMRISYAVFCLKKKTLNTVQTKQQHHTPNLTHRYNIPLTIP